MIRQKLLDATEYRDACFFFDELAGKTLINIIKTVEMVRVIYKDLFDHYGISEPKFSVLLLLKNAPEGLSLSEIGTRMSVSRANITGLIERLEKDGLVQKLEHPEDKRSMKAYLTSRGNELLLALKNPHMTFMENMTEALSAEEKVMMNSIMEKMQTHMLSSFQSGSSKSKTSGTEK